MGYTDPQKDPPLMHVHNTYKGWDSGSQEARKYRILGKRRKLLSLKVFTKTMPNEMKQRSQIFLQIHKPHQAPQLCPD
jgi:hypothetical protein